MLRLPMPPRSSLILLWLLLTGFTGPVLFPLCDLLLSLCSASHWQMTRVAIYGAGEALVGDAQLATRCRLRTERDLVREAEDRAR